MSVATKTQSPVAADSSIPSKALNSGPPDVANAGIDARFPSPEFEAIYQEYARTVYYLALRMLSDPAQAEDAAHDIFLKVFRKLDQFEGHSTVRTWLYRITINHCQNVLRSWHHRNIMGAEDGVLERAGSQVETPLRVLETKELGEQIQRALNSLPEEYRLLLLLVADDKLSYEEAGTLTGQTSDAVRGKLHRARKAFSIAFRQFG